MKCSRKEKQLDHVVEVESEPVLRSMTPDFKKLAALPVRGVIVTAKSADPKFDFVSRFFAPAAGIDEDPVTGSAHSRELLTIIMGRKPSKEQIDKAIPD